MNKSVFLTLIYFISILLFAAGIYIDFGLSSSLKFTGAATTFYGVLATIWSLDW